MRTISVYVLLGGIYCRQLVDNISPFFIVRVRVAANPIYSYIYIYSWMTFRASLTVEKTGGYQIIQSVTQNSILTEGRRPVSWWLRAMQSVPSNSATSSSSQPSSHKKMSLRCIKDIARGFTATNTRRLYSQGEHTYMHYLLRMHTVCSCLGVSQTTTITITTTFSFGSSIRICI